MSTQIENVLSKLYNRSELLLDLDMIKDTLDTHTDIKDPINWEWMYLEAQPEEIAYAIVSLYWDCLRGVYDALEDPEMVPNSLRTYFDLIQFVELGIDGRRSMGSHVEPQVEDVVIGDLYFKVDFENVNIDSVPQGTTVKTRRFSPGVNPKGERDLDTDWLSVDI